MFLLVWILDCFILPKVQKTKLITLPKTVSMWGRTQSGIYFWFNTTTENKQQHKNEMTTFIRSFFVIYFSVELFSPSPSITHMILVSCIFRPPSKTFSTNEASKQSKKKTKLKKQRNQSSQEKNKSGSTTEKNPKTKDSELLDAFVFVSSLWRFSEIHINELLKWTQNSYVPAFCQRYG